MDVTGNRYPPQKKKIVKNRILTGLKLNPQKRQYHFKRIRVFVGDIGNKQEVILALRELELENLIYVVRRSKRYYYGLKGDA